VKQQLTVLSLLFNVTMTNTVQVLFTGPFPNPFEATFMMMANNFGTNRSIPSFISLADRLGAEL